MFQFWHTVPGIRLHTLRPLPGQEYEFQRERRVIAEKRAKSMIYILTDDDMEPLFDIKQAAKLMLTRPWFGILSAMPENATIHRWTIEGYRVFEDSEIMEHIDVGGLRFIRKGACRLFKEQTRVGYDREHCFGMRKNNFRVGYFKNFKAIHHGEGASDVWNQQQKAFA